MSVKPYSTDEEEPLKVSEATASYRICSRHTPMRTSANFPKKEEAALPEGCVSSEDFWSLFENKMKAAYAEL